MSQLERVISEARRRMFQDEEELERACALAALTVTDDVLRAAELSRMASDLIEAVNA